MCVFWGKHKNKNELGLKEILPSTLKKAVPCGNMVFFAQASSKWMKMRVTAHLFLSYPAAMLFPYFHVVGQWWNFDSFHFAFCCFLKDLALSVPGKTILEYPKTNCFTWVCVLFIIIFSCIIVSLPANVTGHSGDVKPKKKEKGRGSLTQTTYKINTKFLSYSVSAALLSVSTVIPKYFTFTSFRYAF